MFFCLLFTFSPQVYCYVRWRPYTLIISTYMSINLWLFEYQEEETEQTMEIYTKLFEAWN